MPHRFAPPNSQGFGHFLTHLWCISKHLQGDEAFEFMSQLSSLADTSTQRSPGRVQHGDHHGVRIIQQCFPRIKIITQTPAIFLGDFGGAPKWGALKVVPNKYEDLCEVVVLPFLDTETTHSTFSVGNLEMAFLKASFPHPNPSLSSKSWP